MFSKLFYEAIAIKEAREENHRIVPINTETHLTKFNTHS